MPSSSQIFPGPPTRRATMFAAIAKETGSRVPSDLETAAAAAAAATTTVRSSSSAGCGSSGGRLQSVIADDPGSLRTTVGKQKKGTIVSLLNNLPPVMFLVCKYQEYRRNQQQLTIRKVTERELLRLNHKIDKLLQRLEEHKHEVAASPGEECVICISAKATMQTFPCAHRVVCRKCFVKTIQVAVSQRMLPLRCVVCRAKILRLNVSGSKTAASSESTMTATTAEAPNGTGSQTPSSSSSSSSADRKEMQSSSRSQRGKHRTRATQRVTPVTAANVRGSAAGILLSRSSESFLRSIDEQDELKELLPLAAAADRCPPLPGHTTCHSSASCRTPSVSFIISGHDGGSKIIGRNDAAEEEEDFRSLVSSSSTRSSMEAIHKPNSARSSTSSCCSTDFQSSSPKANFSLPFLTGFCRRRLQRVRDRISKHKWDPIY